LPATSARFEAGTGALSRLAVRGGAYLTAREAAGACVRLGGTLFTVRLIGPASFGIYSAAAAFTLFIATSAQMGAEVFLIRQEREPDRDLYAQTFTLLLCTSLVLVGLALAASFVAAPLLRPHGMVLPLRVLLLSVPINVCWAPAQAKIERGFGYKRMALLEFGGDIVLYATSVPLAALGYGAWSLVAGFFAWQTYLLLGSFVLSGLWPRLRWSTKTMRSLLGHGVTYSSGPWFYSLAGLVNPLVVGTFNGAAAVGDVAFAQRIAATLAFATRGGSRLGLVAISKVPPEEKKRLRFGIERGTTLQLLALAVPFICFGVVARPIILAAYGHAWTAAIPLCALLGLNAVLNAPSQIQTSVLLARGDNLRAGVSVGIGTAILAIGSLILVPVIGVTGYGVASVLAVVDLVYLDRCVRRVVSFSYRELVPFALALVPPVLAPLVPLRYELILFAPMVAVLVVPGTRRQVFSAITLTRSLLRKAEPVAAEGGLLTIPPLPGSGLRTGVDIVDVTQVAEAIDDFGDRYLRRVYTAHELSCCSGTWPAATAALAGRFAAKEAVLKVLQPEGARPDWRSIEIRRKTGGACEVQLSGTAAALADAAGIGEISISITHEAGLAGAVAVASRSGASRKRRRPWTKR
jgi:phosphopantetheine--protein transferase-like protein